MRRLQMNASSFLGSPRGKLISGACIALLALETLYLLTHSGPAPAPLEVERFAYPVPLAPVGSPFGPSKPIMDKLHGNCSLSKVEYLPAKEELEWFANALGWEPNFCEHVYSYGSTIYLWLTFQQTMMRGQDITLSTPQHISVFSKHVFSYTCKDGSTKKAESWIEPLVGSLRHPMALCDGWAETKRDPVNTLLSREFILLGSVQSPSFFNGRLNFYFDFGASTFLQGGGGPSQSWIIEAYEKRGIKFDRLLMWEAAITDPQEIFNSVPKDLQHAYQYFNIPVGTDFKDQSNPLNILRRLVKAEDFLVLKIGLDTPSVEKKLVNQIIKDPFVHFLIDEMFYEHHVNFKPMHVHWGTEGDSIHLDESYRIFTALRRLGIRMHGWP